MGRSKSLPKMRSSPEMGCLGTREMAMEYWSWVWRGWEK